MVKDVKEIFIEELENIQNLLEHRNYTASARTAHSLITIASYAQHNDGIFVAEVLESIFTQLEPLFLRYKISTDTQNNINESLKKQFKLLLNSYKDMNISKMYESLKELRSVTTTFQLMVPTRFERAEIKRMVRGGII